MQYSVMYFGAQDDPSGYESILQTAQLADDYGYEAIWLPERHFDHFGGYFPNPATLAAALAVHTKRIDLRCGSVVSPLHDSLRIAEEWSMVDRLSAGRTGLSFGSGWNANDFVLASDRYERRRELMWEQITEVRRLWRGEDIVRTNGAGVSATVKTYPRPTRAEPSVWVTVSGAVETARRAGREGCRLLTHMSGKSRFDAEALIQEYRAAAAGAGHGAHVTVMMHALIAHTRSAARDASRSHLRAYLRAAVELEMAAANAGGTQSGGRRGSVGDADPEALEELLDMAVEDYLSERTMIGGPAEIREVVAWATGAGIDEIACLVDFGPSPKEISQSLVNLSELFEMHRNEGGV